MLKQCLVAASLAAASSAGAAERAIDKEVVINATLEQAWASWTTREGIRSFFAPDANIDARSGGPFEVYIDPGAAPGLKGADDMRFLAVQPKKMISFTWNAPPHLSRTRNQHTWVVVEFEGDASTKVRVTHTGWPASGLASEPEWEATFAYFDRAWQGVLGALETYARTGRKA